MLQSYHIFGSVSMLAAPMTCRHNTEGASQLYVAGTFSLTFGEVALGIFLNRATSQSFNQQPVADQKSRWGTPQHVHSRRAEAAETMDACFFLNVF